MARNSNVVKRRRTTCKTGCLTCKARKVKCDEGKPACHRCISTGRTCDGYGIWGGGGNGHAERYGRAMSVSTRNLQHSCLRFSIPTSCYTPDEQSYLDWFHIRTVPKIPGLFPQSFWTILLRQASVTEPAVLHAILTLSSAHRTTRGNEVVTRNTSFSGEQRNFMLRNYSKAIRHLQPHMSSKDRASTRIALIACAVFTCLEFLRGNFKTAQNHLKNGLLVLEEICGAGHDGIVVLQTADATDRWIIETFQRLHVQVELFHRTHVSATLILQQYNPTIAPMNTAFQTLKEAWTELNHILHRIVALSGHNHRHDHGTIDSSNYGSCDSELIPLQQQLQTSLLHWHTTYISSKPILDSEEPTLVIDSVLMSYYTLATILCSTSLSSELAYDAHTARFLTILSNSIHLWKSRPPPKVCKDAGFNLSHSIIDFGWVPPLYYTAIKCRVRRVRLHAVRLLESTMHREGIWDCGILSRVMRTVAEIEDEGLYEDEGSGFALEALPAMADSSQPVLPLESRLDKIRVEMGDEMTESVIVEFRKAYQGSEWKQACVSLKDPPPNGS